VEYPHQKRIKKKKTIQKVPKDKKNTESYYKTHNFLTPVMRIHLKYIYKHFGGSDKIFGLNKLLDKFEIGEKFSKKRCSDS